MWTKFQKGDILVYLQRASFDAPISERHKVIFDHYDNIEWAVVRFLPPGNTSLKVYVHVRNLRP